MTSDIAKITGDRPLQSIDEDRLGYADFARALAASLDSGADPGGLVIAIHGKWGSGKTSAVNMAMDALRERQIKKAPADQTIVVRFNPWWFSEQSDLTRAFFTELTVALGREMSEKVKTSLKSLSKRLTSAADLVAAIATVAGAGGLAIPIAQGLKAAVGEGEIAEKTLQELRQDLEAALIEESRSIVVIMDDIDRLPRDEARQLFRLVKSLADLPYVTYLLVFDREIASEDLDTDENGDRPEWIEKIVQASFDLPPVLAGDLHQLLFDGLNKIPSLSDSVDKERWPSVFSAAIAPWLQTPRNVERLLNAVRASWPVVQNEVDVGDFISLECLRLFAPRLYARIATSEGSVTGEASRDSVSALGKANALLERVAPADREKAKSTLSELFPRLEAVWSSISDSDWQGWDRGKRACSGRHFETYFRFRVSSHALSQAELAAFEAALEDTERARNIIRSLRKERRAAGGDKAITLLEEWRIIAAGELPEGRARRAAIGFLEIGDEFFSEENVSASAFALPLAWRLLFVIEPCLKALHPSERFKILSQAVSHASSIFTVAHVVNSEREDHGRYNPEKAKSADEWILSENDLIRIERAMAKRLALVAEDQDIADVPTRRNLVYLWQSLAGTKKVRAWASKQMKTDEGAARVMKTTIAVSFNSTGRRSWKHSYIAPDASEWVNLHKLERRATEIVSLGSSDARQIAEQFLSALRAEDDD